MAHSLAIEILIEKRNKLEVEKARITRVIDDEISSIDTSIESLSGKKVWEILAETQYDDELPDYIKASIEEI
jgi:uncharacterized protein YbcI